MVLKNLITGIEIVILVNYQYLVDISRWESLCVPKMLFGFHAILNRIDTRVITPKYEGSCMVYKFEWDRKQKYISLNTHTLVVSKNVKVSL